VQRPEASTSLKAPRYVWFLPKFIACTLPCMLRISIFSRKYDLMALIPLALRYRHPSISKLEQAICFLHPSATDQTRKVPLLSGLKNSGMRMHRPMPRWTGIFARTSLEIAEPADLSARSAEARVEPKCFIFKLWEIHREKISRTYRISRN
jgi:hypothetical protein